MLNHLALLVVVPVALLSGQTQSAMNAEARSEFERADSELTKTDQDHD